MKIGHVVGRLTKGRDEQPAEEPQPLLDRTLAAIGRVKTSPEGTRRTVLAGAEESPADSPQRVLGARQCQRHQGHVRSSVRWRAAAASWAGQYGLFSSVLCPMPCAAAPRPRRTSAGPS